MHTGSFSSPLLAIPPRPPSSGNCLAATQFPTTMRRVSNENGGVSPAGPNQVQDASMSTLSLVQSTLQEYQSSLRNKTSNAVLPPAAPRAQARSRPTRRVSDSLSVDESMAAAGLFVLAAGAAAASSSMSPTASVEDGRATPLADNLSRTTSQRTLGNSVNSMVGAAKNSQSRGVGATLQQVHQAAQLERPVRRHDSSIAILPEPSLSRSRLGLRDSGRIRVGRPEILTTDAIMMDNNHHNHHSAKMRNVPLDCPTEGGKVNQFLSGLKRRIDDLSTTNSALNKPSTWGVAPKKRILLRKEHAQSTNLTAASSIAAIPAPTTSMANTAVPSTSTSSHYVPPIHRRSLSLASEEEFDDATGSLVNSADTLYADAREEGIMLKAKTVLSCNQAQIVLPKRYGNITTWRDVKRDSRKVRGIRSYYSDAGSAKRTSTSTATSTKTRSGGVSTEKAAVSAVVRGASVIGLLSPRGRVARDAVELVKPTSASASNQNAAKIRKTRRKIAGLIEMRIRQLNPAGDLDRPAFLANALEARLYDSSTSLEEYADQSTLQERLRAVSMVAGRRIEKVRSKRRTPKKGL